MIADLLFGLGMVAVIEGLVLALAPLRFDELLAILRKMPLEKRQSAGLAVAGLGVIVIWVAKVVIG